MRLILSVYEQCKGNKTQTARFLGINPKKLARILKAFGLKMYLEQKGEQ